MKLSAGAALTGTAFSGRRVPTGGATARRLAPGGNVFWKMGDMRAARMFLRILFSVPGGFRWVMAVTVGVMALAVPAASASATSTSTSTAPTTATSGGSGRSYWVVTAGGLVVDEGNGGYYGSVAPPGPSHPVVDMASSGTGKGYWLVASDGGIFSYGDAKFFGSTG
ncbi:MAG: hypothetical protein ACYCS7_07120, partial [Acidimicrobiales bacterium]